MAKILKKIINYCNEDCPYYQDNYDEPYGYIIQCNHENGKVIYNNEELYKKIEAPYGPKKYNLSTIKKVFNDDLFPISPPLWCPLDDIDDKELSQE